MAYITALMERCPEANDYIMDYQVRFLEDEFLKRVCIGSVKKKKRRNKYIVAFELRFLFPKLNFIGTYVLMISAIALIMWKHWFFFIPLTVGLIMVLSYILHTPWFYGKMLKKGVSRSSYGKAGRELKILDYDGLVEEVL